MKNFDLYKIHISVFLFGFAGLFGKWIHLDAITIVWGRVLFASISFGLLFLLQKRNPFKVSLNSYIRYFFLGALLAFHWWSFFKSIQVSTVAIGLFSFSSFPVFTVFLESVFFKEKWKIQYLLLAFLSLFGVFLLFPEFSWHNEYFIGVVWGVMSGLSFAVLTIFNRILLKRKPAIEIAFFQDLFAFVLLSPFVVLQLTSINYESWLQLLVLGTIFTALAHVLFISGLKTIQAKQAAIISNLEPIYGVFFAYLLLGEFISWNVVFGGSFIIMAAFLSTFLQKKNS